MGKPTECPHSQSWQVHSNFQFSRFVAVNIRKEASLDCGVLAIMVRTHPVAFCMAIAVMKRRYFRQVPRRNRS